MLGSSRIDHVVPLRYIQFKRGSKTVCPWQSSIIEVMFLDSASAGAIPPIACDEMNPFGPEQDVQCFFRRCSVACKVEEWNVWPCVSASSVAVFMAYQHFELDLMGLTHHLQVARSSGR
jgi:hypothetical protein